MNFKVSPTPQKIRNTRTLDVVIPIAFDPVLADFDSELLMSRNEIDKLSGSSDILDVTLRALSVARREFA